MEVAVGHRSRAYTAFLDPWGHEYIYVYPCDYSNCSYGIYSLGPDGVSETGGDDPDDLNSWDENKLWRLAPLIGRL
jgi:hypothetical protein